MRVLMSANWFRRIKSREHSESGAVAVTVAALSLVLVGVGAFTLDFGMSYASTRQLQTSADAAALAAANYLKSQPGTCATIVVTSSVITTARDTADSIMLENRAGSTRERMDVTCVNGGRSLQVRYVSAGSTPSFLGPIFGRTGGYASSRPATALVEVPDSAIGVRPYAICAAQIPAGLPSVVYKMELPALGNSLCPGADSSGNWWSVDCPEAFSNGTSDLGDTTVNGCSGVIRIVPGQTTTPARTPIGLRTYLEGYCTARNASCLSANPGNLRGTPIVNAWDTLIDKKEPILLPVFCGGLPTGLCDRAAVVNAGGNNAIYPVQSLLGVIVCGYHWGSKNNDAGMTGICGGANNPLGLRSSTGDSNDNYLLLRSVPISISGGDSTVTTCGIGDPTCDRGARRVFLSE